MTGFGSESASGVRAPEGGTGRGNHTLSHPPAQQSDFIRGAGGGGAILDAGGFLISRFLRGSDGSLSGLDILAVGPF